MAGQNGGSWWNPVDNIKYWANAADNQLTNAVSQQNGGSFTPKTTQPISTLGDGGVTNVLGASTSNSPSQNVTTPQTETSNQNNGNVSTWAYDPTAVASAQDLINQAQFSLDRIGTQRTIGNDNLTNSYTEARNNIAKDKALNERNYTTSKTQTQQDNERARQAIDTRTVNRSNALQRFMGAAGGGDSEAARMLAPYAAARTGTQAREQVAQTYGRNMQNLDQNWGDYNTQVTDQLTGLTKEEQQKRNELEAALLQSQYTAQDNLSKAQQSLAYAKNGDAASAAKIREAQLPQMYAILQQIDQLSKQYQNPVATVKDLNYVAPDLANYDLKQNAAVGADNTNAQQVDAVDPTYAYLLQKSKEDQQNLGY